MTQQMWTHFREQSVLTGEGGRGQGSNSREVQRWMAYYFRSECDNTIV